MQKEGGDIKLTVGEALVKLFKRHEKVTKQNALLKAENKRLRKELERLKKGK